MLWVSKRKWNHLSSFELVFLVVLRYKLLISIYIVSQFLQRKEMNLFEAKSLLKAALDSVMTWRDGFLQSKKKKKLPRLTQSLGERQRHSVKPAPDERERCSTNCARTSASMMPSNVSKHQYSLDAMTSHQRSLGIVLRAIQRFWCQKMISITRLIILQTSTVLTFLQILETNCFLFAE